MFRSGLLLQNWRDYSIFGDEYVYVYSLDQALYRIRMDGSDLRSFS